MVSVSAWLPPPRRLYVVNNRMKLEGAIWFHANVGPLLRMRTLWIAKYVCIHLEKRQGCAALQGRDGRGGLDRACHTKPGLIAYECSSCSYVTSVLTSSAGSKERWQ